ncbi:hypothetical protein CDCA_CDCA01G0385 [Cyanidium caldarium]|uniref:Obg-like ATPase 1 n=1 Tax=Cyanidium caldarium TaxID=2771 RepID=A0AAV9IQK9_CYACA|nr:hypothetical protein CDCA_CDCA01G0385 [Cyanidium caldarium]
MRRVEKRCSCTRQAITAGNPFSSAMTPVNTGNDPAAFIGVHGFLRSTSRHRLVHTPLRVAHRHRVAFGCRGLRSKLQTGLVGLPNVGKSTLFNALCEQAQAQAANFPFCTVEPNVGVVAVPDARLDELARVGRSARIVPTALEFVDIAGLVAGASRGEGLGNQFLSNIRQCDAVVHVVRCFQDDQIVHVAGSVDPVRDMETIGLELALADAAQVERRRQRSARRPAAAAVASAGGSAGARLMEEAERSALDRVAEWLDAAVPVRQRWSELSSEEQRSLQPLGLLTAKPMLYAANVADVELADAAAALNTSPSSSSTTAAAAAEGMGAPSPQVEAVRAYAAREGARVVAVSAQVESELAELTPDERREYLESLGVCDMDTVGLRALIRATYDTLALRTYFTCGPEETRAWTIRRGTRAPQAAGVIHSDFERGFIRAETVGYAQLIDAGSLATARERGLVRSEGKEYVVQEGDVMLFRFNV